VRELENVIGHACMMASGERIDVQDLPDYLRSTEKAAEEPEADALSTIEKQERQMVVSALNEAKGNQSEAARILKIGRDALRYKLKKFGIESSAVN
jgi:DNA-binding NtrC family response regulator